jgi:hypothetical protein
LKLSDAILSGRHDPRGHRDGNGREDAAGGEDRDEPAGDSKGAAGAYEMGSTFGKIAGTYSHEAVKQRGFWRVVKQQKWSA